MKKHEVPEQETDKNSKKSKVSGKAAGNLNKKRRENIGKELAELQKKMQLLNNENAEYKEKYLRLAAEFDNYRKMTLRETEKRAQNIKESVILDVLSIIDNLDRTINAISNKKKSDPVSKGVQLTHSQAKKLLEKYDVEEIGSVGEKFDLELHEAMMMVENENFPANVVVEEHLKGYKINGRVLRYAKVAVNNG